MEQMAERLAAMQVQLDEIQEKIDLLLNTNKRGNRVGGIELAMEVTGYKRSTIYAMSCRGEIPCHKGRRKLTFREDELIAWLTGQLKNWKKPVVNSGRKSKLSTATL